MKKTLALLSLLSLAGAVVAKPALTVGTPTYDPVSRLMTVAYALSEPAVVTASLSTNGAPVDIAKLNYFGGDVFRLVSNETATVVWRVDGDFPGAQFDAEAVTVELTAWSVDAPPDYMVIDLNVRNCVRYYASSNDIPGGVGLGSSDLNRMERLVMRRIPAKDVTFRMGSPDTGKYPNRSTSEVAHLVTLRNDYYMGIYPVTQAQFAKFRTGTAVYCDREDSAIRPVEKTYYDALRGSTADGIDWPTTGTNVLASSYCGLLRDWSGVAVDLPTEAQWEYAARAGSPSELTSGLEMVGNGNATSDANINPLGWMKQEAINVYGSAQTGPVGTHLPNNWGLYDVQGNNYEICRDWYVADLTTLDNPSDEPSGPSSGTARVLRSGTFKWNVVNSRLSCRGSVAPAYAYNDANGFRLYAPYVAK